MVWVIILYIKQRKSYFLMSVILILNIIIPVSVYAAGPEVSCPSAILMDYETGEVLYEKNPDEKRALASVTKIMTMLICMDEIKSGNLKYDDIVTGSANAKSYGGSTIFLDEGEQMTVKDILKGIAVASGNDASVAIAEHISGSEASFVNRMNQKAQTLGMKNTNFINCNGLDADGHYSTARDIAIMSRELMKYEDIFQFTTIWMDSLRNGEFTLSNTNKLIRYYEGATGLKTGSTDNALFCISATAKRDDMHLIAVIMGAETSKLRQSDASTLLNYGFNNFKINKVITKNENVKSIKVSKSNIHNMKLIPKEDYNVLSLKNENSDYEITYDYNTTQCAPLKKGDIGGKISVKLNEKEIKSVELLYSEDANKRSFANEFKNNLINFIK